MSDTINIFWPGDYRAMPNQTALPMLETATAELEKSLSRLGRKHRRVGGFMTTPTRRSTSSARSTTRWSGVFVHWAYAPHTVDGVVGKDNPLLLASNFSGTWPGLVALLNTGASLESVGRKRLARLDRRRRLDATTAVHGAAWRMVLDRPHRLRRVGRPRGPQGVRRRGGAGRQGARGDPPPAASP